MKCWACGNEAPLEEHHVIPQSKGGKYGPTVMICPICHYRVHNGKCEGNQRLILLREFITQSIDKSTKKKISVDLSNEDWYRLKLLASTMNKTYAETITLMIRLLFRQMIGGKPNDT